MTTLLTDITGVDWSPKVGAPGSVVENDADINQCIRVILETPKGSRPHEPLFGSEVHSHLDMPFPEAIPRIAGAVMEAIELWEPRVRLVRVVPSRAEAAAGKISLLIEWQYKDYSKEIRQVEVTV